MKKYFILLGIIIISSIIVFYINNKVNLKNISYNNGNINYPYFKIDYIDDYIYDIVFQDINRYDDIFIDYDYSINDNIIDIFLYKYYKYNQIIKNSITKVNIDLKDKKINKDIIKSSNITYNIINNQIIDKKKKIIAFTFDDGPNYNTNKIINILNKYNVRATFFVVGSNINNYKDTLKYMIDSNMEIGNHTYSHKLLTRLSENKIKEEINKTSNQVFDITGTKSTLFRPSYGAYNNKIKNLCPYPLIIWNVDTLDWKYHNSKRIAKSILKNVSDGDIVLMHDIYSATVNAIDIVIPKLLDQGYQIVTVSELFYYNDINLINRRVYGHI